MKKQIILIPLYATTIAVWIVVGVKAVDQPVAEIPPLQVEDIVPEFGAYVTSESILAQNGINVPESIRFESEAAGNAFNVCPEILQALAWKESRFQSDVKRGSCIGLMQINQRLHGDRLDAYGSDYYSIHSQIWAAASLIRDLSLDLGQDGEPAEMAAVLAAYHGEDNPVGRDPSKYVTEVMEVSAALERAHGK